MSPSTVDHLVVGAGFSGAVVAERLASAGRRVLVIDRRPHIGGNAYDCVDEAGVRIHPYGPHIFHTNSQRVVDYLSRFTEWYPYEHRVRAFVDGQLFPIPINLDTVNAIYGQRLSEAEIPEFFEKIREKRPLIRTSEDVVVNAVGQKLFEKFFRGYTRKQWGLEPCELDASVCGRIPVRANRDDRYFGDSFQRMPSDGYTAMFERMLAHPNIRVELETDYRSLPVRAREMPVVFTGCIDELLDRQLGPLPYRSLRFEHESFPELAQYQNFATVNFPNDHSYTRITEFKHFTGLRPTGTSIVREYPSVEGDPYYPVPTETNKALFKQYWELGQRLPNVVFVGRLAQYRYYNMDQAVAAALEAADALTGIKKATAAAP